MFFLDYFNILNRYNVNEAIVTNSSVIIWRSLEEEKVPLANVLLICFNSGKIKLKITKNIPSFFVEFIDFAHIEFSVHLYLKTWQYGS